MNSNQGEKKKQTGGYWKIGKDGRRRWITAREAREEANRKKFEVKSEKGSPTKKSKQNKCTAQAKEAAWWQKHQEIYEARQKMTLNLAKRKLGLPPLKTSPKTILDSMKFKDTLDENMKSKPKGHGENGRGKVTENESRVANTESGMKPTDSKNSLSISTIDGSSV